MKRAAQATTETRADREGKRMLAGHFDPETYKAFKVLAARQGSNTCALLAEGLELLFEKYGARAPKQLKRQIADQQSKLG